MLSVDINESFYPELPRPRLRVVVVDDSPDFLEAACALIESFCYAQIAGVGRNGFEALELATCCEPDLLIMDVNMPELDGIQAATVISRLCPSTKILLMSGDNDDETRERCRTSGAHAFIPKHDLTQALARGSVGVS